MTSNDQPRRSDRHRSDYDDYDYDDEPRHKGLVKRILLWVLGIIVLLFVAGTALFFYYASSAPRISRSELAGQSTTTIYDDQNRIISRLGAQKREVAKSNQVPDNLKHAVVAIEDRVAHPLYKKIVGRTYKLKAHDEQNACGVGDKVKVMETRPLSKDKRWRVVEIIEKAK